MLFGTQSDSGWKYRVAPRDLDLPAPSPGTPASSATEKAKTAVLEYVRKYGDDLLKSDVVKRVAEITGITKTPIYTAVTELVGEGRIVTSEKAFPTFRAQVLSLGPPPEADEQQSA